MHPKVKRPTAPASAREPRECVLANSSQIAATALEMQVRRIRERFGLSPHLAAVVAALAFSLEASR
jgi:hypothetical protein